VSRIAIPGLVAQLLQDGAAVVRAEIALFKARATTRLAAAKTGLILFAAAAVVAIVSLIGLVTGLVMALAELVNPAIAGLIVLIVGLLIAGILGWIGAAQFASKPEAVVETLPALENKP
jgi:type III secretory pathway component EscS